MVSAGAGRRAMWRWSFLAMLLLLMAASGRFAGALTAGQCKAERDVAVKECMAVVFGRMPSPACCERARVSHEECICPAVTPKLMSYVDPNRAIRLIEGCGRKVPRHFKCGSFTTP
ncbi:uncharacterized protein LOC111022647 [Momordica charantia]|uniref:Uncharacterized protein LOC111022647 n=1 Tax=Momordica charantia TaxID=3673 RepID=A0A6J1DPK2_MOMCH|nr:uncharacterized protein LOC111022647 [Momordica charantia]